MLRDTTLTTLALAVALGWSLYQLTAGVAGLVTSCFTAYNGPVGRAFIQQLQLTVPLRWHVGDRLLNFGGLASGAIEVALVVVVALFVQKLQRPGRGAANQP